MDQVTDVKIVLFFCFVLFQERSIIIFMSQEAMIFNCPHCNLLIEVLTKDIACGIFRHGTFISNGNQMDPNSNKQLCDTMVQEQKIYGCGKPFRIDLNSKEVTICDYI